MAKRKKGAATKAKKPGARKLAPNVVDFTKLHEILDEWYDKLEEIHIATQAPKIRFILDDIEALKSEIDCQTTMVIEF